MALLPAALIFLLISLSSATASHSNTGYVLDDLQSEQSMQILFQTWLVKHGKVYKGATEISKRFKIFKQKLEFIHSVNSDNRSYWLGLNKFSDLTTEEFMSIYINKATVLASSNTTKNAMQYDTTENAPDSVDWREKGAVTGVKDQGSCGCCWAFASTGAIESINMIVRGVLPSLSEQELMDCDKISSGCDGGLMTYAFAYVQANGIGSETDYPYQAQKNSQCSANNNSDRISIDGYTLVETRNENALKAAVANQPVAVRLRGSSQVFQSYAGGILTGTDCGTQPNHEGLMVGYGTEGGMDYWIMKNSWGTSWGEQGYIRLERNVEDALGVCGIAYGPCYPTISS